MTQHLKSLIQMAFQNSALNSASIFSSSITKKNHNINSSEKIAIGKSTKMSDKLMNSNEKLKVTPRVNSTKASSEYSCASNGSSSSSSSRKIETKLKMASIDQPANIPMLVVRSHHPSTSTTTNGENTINCQLRVRKGTAVNALFMINNWIYVKTFEENEGFIPKKCCEAFGGSKKSSSSKRQLVFNGADEASICSSEISSKPNVNHTYISIVDDPNLDNIYNEKRNHAQQMQDNENNDLNCSFEYKDNTNLSLFSISRCYVNEPCSTENKQAVKTPIDKKASKISRANEMDSLRKSKSRNRKLSIALKQIPSAMTLTMIEQEIDMTMTMKKRVNKVNSKQQAERNYNNNIDNESDKNLNLPNIIQNLNQNQDKKKMEKMRNCDEFIYYTNETVSQKRHHMSSEAKSKYLLARKRIKLYAALKQERVCSAAKRAKYAHKSASSSSSLSSCSNDDTKKVDNNDAAYDFLMTCSSDLRFSPVQKPKQQQQQQQQQKKPVDLYQVICDYEADFKGDLSVKKGDYVYVAGDDDAEANKRLVSNEWIFVRKLTLNDRICEGFVPRNHVIRL